MTAKPLILWGKHPAHGDQWLKIEPYKGAEQAIARRREGWTVATAPIGRHPQDKQVTPTQPKTAPCAGLPVSSPSPAPQRPAKRQGTAAIAPFGDRLKAARKQSGRTQAEAALEMRVGRRSVQVWEQGEAVPIYPAQVGALAILAEASPRKKRKKTATKPAPLAGQP